MGLPDVDDWEGAEFWIEGSEEYFSNNPCGYGDGNEYYLVKADHATCLWAYKDGFEFRLDSYHYGTDVCSSFKVKRTALEKYIDDGVFILKEKSVKLNTSEIVKNNDGRSTCFSCGQPTRDYGSIGGLLPIGKICTGCGK